MNTQKLKTSTHATDILYEVKLSVYGGVQSRLVPSEGPIQQLFDYQKETYRSLSSLVERSLRWNESNTVLLLGPPGSGKSFTVNCVLAKLMAERKVGKDVLVVKLNGLIHISGHSAVEKIISDLEIEENVSSKVSSFESSLALLLEFLYQSKKKVTPIIFILDNFDLFTKHKNQNLLYSLFDISQSNACPIAVVGITARLDVVELLEKRVKSRFSHRQLYLATDYTFPEYLGIVHILLDPRSLGDKEWTEHIAATLAHPLVLTSLKQIYTCSKNICILQNFLTIPLFRLRRRGFRLDPQDFQDAWKNLNLDACVEMMANLSLLEKCLMVSASKLYEQNPNAKLNFETIYREYEHFSKRSSSIELFSRSVALRAMEHLLQLELLHPSEGKGKQRKELMCVSILVSREQVKRGILDASVCPTDIIHWAGTISSY